MIKRLMIVGSGSEIWNMIKGDFTEFSVNEVPGKKFLELCEIGSEDLILYLANPPRDIFLLHLELIKKLKPKNILFFSSLVTILPTEFSKYRYVDVKKDMEKLFTEEMTKVTDINCLIVRPAIIYFDKRTTIKPPIAIEKHKLISVIKHSMNKEFKFDKLNLYDRETNFKSHYLYELAWNYLPFKVCRFFDLILRLLGKKNYGYTYFLARQVYGEITKHM